MSELFNSDQQTLFTIPSLHALLKPFKPQYPQTNSPNWSLYISIKNKLREFDKRSKHFSLSDHFTNSHKLFFWLCNDTVLRKLMFVILGRIDGIKQCHFLRGWTSYKICQCKKSQVMSLFIQDNRKWRTFILKSIIARNYGWKCSLLPFWMHQRP